ncbi:MAG: hypothetical protein ACPGEG_09520 [Salibacteraceae bacterium]
MLNTFRTNTPQSMFFSTAIAVVVLLPNVWLSFSDQENIQNMSLITPLVQSFSIGSQKVISFFLLILTILYSNYTVLNHRILGTENRYTAVFVSLFIAIGATFQLSMIFPLCGLLLVRFFDRCFEIQKSTYPNNLVFDASFLVGLLSIIYFPLVFLLPVVWVSIFYSSKISLKAFVLSIVIFLVVIYMASGVFFLFDLPVSFSFEAWSSKNLMHLALVQKVILAVVGVVLLFSIPKYLDALRLNKILVRGHLSLLLWSFIPISIAFLGINQPAPNLLAFLSFPFGILTALLFLKMTKRIVSNILFFSLVICVVYYKYSLLL